MLLIFSGFFITLQVTKKLLMIVYHKYIENIIFELTKGSKLLIDTKIPHSILFWFSGSQIDILRMPTEDEEFCFFILFFEISLFEIL